MDTAEKLDKALEFIAHSRDELEQGKVVVLEGFQNDVKKICEHIGAMEQQEMLQYSSKLEELSASLKTLEHELRTQQSQVQREIFSLNRKQKALQTYQTVSHSHKENKEEQE